MGWHGELYSFSDTTYTLKINSGNTDNSLVVLIWSLGLEALTQRLQPKWQRDPLVSDCPSDASQNHPGEGWWKRQECVQSSPSSEPDLPLHTAQVPRAEIQQDGDSASPFSPGSPWTRIQSGPHFSLFSISTHINTNSRILTRGVAMGMEATHAEGRWRLHGQRTQTEATSHLCSALSLLSRSRVGSSPEAREMHGGPASGRLCLPRHHHTRPEKALFV